MWEFSNQMVIVKSKRIRWSCTCWAWSWSRTRKPKTPNTKKIAPRVYRKEENNRSIFIRATRDSFQKNRGTCYRKTRKIEENYSILPIQFILWRKQTGTEKKDKIRICWNTLLLGLLGSPPKRTHSSFGFPLSKTERFKNWSQYFFLKV